MGITIDAKFVHITDGTLRLRQYADNTLAVQVESLVNDDGMVYPDTETLSVNMSDYLPAPPPWHFYVKAYSEHEGLADALVTAGLAEIVGDPIYFGPFNTEVRLMCLTEPYRSESTLTGTLRNYEVGEADDTPDDNRVHCKFEWREDGYVASWICTRYAEHNGNHAAGTGHDIAAVHPKED